MADSYRINVTLDGEYGARLSRLAERARGLAEQRYRLRARADGEKLEPAPPGMLKSISSCCFQSSA